jgi:hypothetical protein
MLRGYEGNAHGSRKNARADAPGELRRRHPAQGKSAKVVGVVNTDGHTAATPGSGEISATAEFRIPDTDTDRRVGAVERLSGSPVRALVRPSGQRQVGVGVKGEVFDQAC